LLSATRKLIEDDAAAQQLGRAAKAKSGRYSWSATCDGFLEVFAEIAAPQASSAG
jgi:hypothetical protein